MKRYYLLLPVALLLVIALVFGVVYMATPPAPTEPPTEAPTEPPTEPPILAGFFTEAEKTYYRTESGELHTGWLSLNDAQYYLDESGVLQIGWKTIDGNDYYFKDDGSMSRGVVEIDGKNHYFTSAGTEFVLVNPWNFLPEDYDANIVAVEKGHKVADVCAEALMQMLADCRAAGFDAQIASSYRSHERQIELYNNKVQYYIDRDYSEEEARKKAGTIVAVPGTSEHELGLAVDLVDGDYWKLNEQQENTAAQKWLMAHCWEYGFILRYPNGKSDVTGIVYEPWHYRYVGQELALEIKDSGLCLEEYFLTLK